MKLDFEQLYENYGPMVLRRCRQILLDEASALDAMQEVFARVLIKQDMLTLVYPSTLLYKIATNIALNMIREKKRRMEAPDGGSLIDSIAAIGDTSEDLENKTLLDKIFKRDRASTRYMAILHFVDGLTLKEVARETNMSVSGIRKRFRDLKNRIQEFKEFYNE